MLTKKGVDTKGVNPCDIAPQLYNGILTEELLCRAIVNPDGTRLFSDSKTLALAATGDEMDVLLTEYQITRELHGPRAVSLSDEAVAAWTKAVEEDVANAIPFYTNSAPMAQIQLIQCLANRSRDAQMDSCSSSPA